MKKLLAIAVALLLLCTSVFPSAFASSEEEEWIFAYREILESAAEERLSQLENDLGPGYDLLVECSYLLYDIDKDGCPEMIVKTGTCEADYMGKVYTYRNHCAEFAGDVSMGHSSVYSYPGENGIIFYWGHMGFASAESYQLVDGELSFKSHLFEDDLNSRLQEDPDAEYTDPGIVVPGAVYLTLVPASLTLPMTEYRSTLRNLEGQFVVSVVKDFPDHDPDFYDKIIAGNGLVCAVQTDIFANNPGDISFQNLLKKDVAADWMSGDLRICSMQSADLNGDGQLECILQLSSDQGDDMRFYLSEQDGIVYAYLENYAFGTAEADRNGNLLMDSSYSVYLRRLIFDREECFLMDLPIYYYDA